MQKCTKRQGRRPVQRRNARLVCAIEQMEARVLLSIADWTFETSQPAGTESAIGPFNPETGAGSASGLHASSATAYSSPAGNGSAHSFSSNTWAVGDYYQFEVSTAGFGSITMQYDQTSSTTGPGNFLLEYSTTGTTGSFTAIGTQTTVIPNSATSATVPGAGAWSSTGTENAAYTFTPNLSSVQSAISNQSTLYLRLVDNSTLTANDVATNPQGTTPVAASGTDRIDNVIISGTALVLPSIGSFTVNPTSVTVNSGTTVTLTASNITDANAGSSIQSVKFYQGSTSGTLLGTVTTPDGSGNYTLSGVSTTGLTTGTTNYVAVVTDNFGNTNSPVSTATLSVVGTEIGQFDSTTESVNENAGTVSITIDRVTGSISQPLTLDWATSNGTQYPGTSSTDVGAVAGVDYTAVAPGTQVTIPAGDSSFQFTIPITNVATFSGTRSFNVTLTQDSANPTTTVGSNSTTVVTITDTAPAADDTPNGITTSTYEAIPTAGTGSVDSFMNLSYGSHNSFENSYMPEMSFGTGSTVFPGYGVVPNGISSLQIGIDNLAVNGVAGDFDLYLLTNDSVATSSLKYNTASGDTGAAVLGTPPEAGATYIGTAYFPDNVAGYNYFTFDNLTSNTAVENDLVNYFNSAGSPNPIRFVIVPSSGTLTSADWEGDAASNQPTLSLLVQPSPDTFESFTLGSATDTINKGSSDLITVTRTDPDTTDSATVPYTLTGTDVNGPDYTATDAETPSNGTTTDYGTFNFGPGQTTASVTISALANATSVDRTFTLTLGAPVTNTSSSPPHVGTLGAITAEVVTIHDPNTDNIVATNSDADTDELATVEPAGSRTGTNGTAQWQAEGTNNGVVADESYAIAEFNNTSNDPSDVFFPNDSNDVPGSSDSVGTINSITLNTVSTGESYIAAGLLNVYLIPASETPTWPLPSTAPGAITYNSAIVPTGFDPTQYPATVPALSLSAANLLGSFTVNKNQSTSAYTDIPLTGATQGTLNTLIGDLNSGAAFDIVIVAEDADVSMSVVGDVGTTDKNAPEIGINYTPADITPVQPTWVTPNPAPSTSVTWQTYGNVLTVNGSATIVSDPGGDEPVITDNGSSSTIAIPASSGNTIHIGGVNLTGTSTVTFSSVASGRSASNHRVLVIAGTGNFSVDGTSKLNLFDNDAIFTGGSLSAVTAAVTSGYNGDLWNGSGIDSSVAAATPSYTALGIESNDNGSGTALVSTFDQQPVSDGDVLVKYTYVGDAVLAGTFSDAAMDYLAIDSAYSYNTTPHPPAVLKTGWANGDFNYDGLINGDDYTLLDNAYNSRGSQTATPLSQVAGSTPAVAAVPSSGFTTGTTAAVSIPESSSAANDLLNKDKKSVADELFDDDSSAG